MLWLVVLIPALLGILTMVVPVRIVRRSLLLVGSLAHSATVVWLCFIAPKVGMAGGGVSGGMDDAWVGLDGLGKLFLCVTSGLFLAVSVYTLGYLKREATHPTQHDVQEEFLFRNESDATFLGCLLLFLATMSLVCISQHLGLLWVAVEATTLVSAPLICFHRHHRSLEATWKYLLICSVGIALALLGNFFLAFAGRGSMDHLTMHELLAKALTMDQAWLKAAFLMLLVGYGTKMGLAPMHTWLPDAHSEAPSMVSALLSAALLNCAFLGILRGHSVLAAAGLEHFSGELLVWFGLISMGVASVFLINQADYKRMLAYSSIEHMGILALGVGLGGLAASGAMLHAVNHSMTKGLLFLVAGNLLAIYRTKNVADVRGVLQISPATGCLWLIGFLAITGSPPFGLFLSEITILKGAMDLGRWGIAIAYLLILAVIFAAMAKVILPMMFGTPPKSPSEGSKLAPSPATGFIRQREPWWSVAPAMAMATVVLVLGLYVPPSFWNFLGQVASEMGVH